MTGGNEPDDDALFTRAEGDDTVIVHGDSSGRVVLRITGTAYYVLVEGEPEGHFLADCFRDGIAMGRMPGSRPTLVDLTRFTGCVDWDAIGAIRAMWRLDSDAESSNGIAYVVRNDGFDALIKIVRGLFGRTRHRIFESRAEALSWLCGLARAG